MSGSLRQPDLRGYRYGIIYVAPYISMSKRNIGLGPVYLSGETGFLPAVEPPAVLFGQRLELRIFCELFRGMSRPEGIV